MRRHRDGAQVRETAEAAARGSAVGELLLDLWRRVRIDWSFATDQLSRAFREHKKLGSNDRRFVAETLYGLIRNLRRVDEALALGGVKSSAAAPDRERLVAFLLLDGHIDRDCAEAVMPAVDWDAVLSFDARAEAEKKPWRKIARRHSFPDWLAKQLARSYGDDAVALAAALGQRAPMTVRVNTLSTSRDALALELAAAELDPRPTEYAPSGITVGNRTNLFRLPAFQRGAFEAQDEGSQLIAELVAPPPRGIVIDACAGAGGKTLALAAMMENRGRVIACDVDRRKLTEMRRRAKRAGATNIQTVQLSPSFDEALPAPLEKLRSAADRVLVDAPCTGTGALRRNPEARWRLSPSDIERFTELQFAIASRALTWVKPGGRLIYATCSLLEAENRAVVDRLLASSSDTSIMTAAEIWGKARALPVCDPTGTYLEVAPHTHDCDGFFAAVIRRAPA